ncbi:hypothetical protein ACX27_02945 [Nostoc piscinale CENA21]|uniref:Uncharacterized protein n=1 Tax=Nostoc piscinale CENA21 TaxID=224013 RepID=A0A0M4SUH2_9NOSO|nr:hypothetical protein ACX27_02945 [Nostoc piscinale CENA21]
MKLLVAEECFPETKECQERKGVSSIFCNCAAVLVQGFPLNNIPFLNNLIFSSLHNHNQLLTV